MNLEEAFALGARVAAVFVMAAFALSLDLSAFLSYLKRPRAIVVGLCCQFLLLPLLAFSCCLLVGDRVPLHLKLGLLLTACCPSGSNSNLAIFLVGADISLSVAMTALSSILSLVFLPVNFYLYGTALTRLAANTDDVPSINLWELFIATGTLLVGLVIGLAMNHWQEYCSAFYYPLGCVAPVMWLTLVVLAPAINAQSADPFWTYPHALILISLVPSSLGFLCGLLLPRQLLSLPKPSCVSIAVETSFQNAGLAIVIIALAFEKQYSASVLGVPMLYQFLAVPVTALALIVLAALGWTDSRSLEHESFTCCTLLDRLKLYWRSKVVRTRDTGEMADLDKWDNDTMKDMIPPEERCLLEKEPMS